jgi:hypothetical protein
MQYGASAGATMANGGSKRSYSEEDEDSGSLCIYYTLCILFTLFIYMIIDGLVKTSNQKYLQPR